MPRNKRIPPVVTTQTPELGAINAITQEPLASSSVEHEHIDTAMEDLSADINEQANDSHAINDLSATHDESMSTAVPTGTVDFQGVVPKKRSLAETEPSVEQEAISPAKRTKSHVVTLKVEPAKLKAICNQLAPIKTARTKSTQRKTVGARSAKSKASNTKSTQRKTVSARSVKSKAPNTKSAKSKSAQSKTTHTKAAQSKAAVSGKGPSSKPTARTLKDIAKLEREQHQAKPKPSAQPLLWADDRQGICETIPSYYQAWRCSTYTKEGIAYGLLLDKDRSEGGYIDAQVIICRAGGGFDLDENGSSVQVRDHKRSDANVACFEKNKKEHIPLVVILGHNCCYSPVAMPHRYCILDFFYVTDFWPENRNGCVLYRIRLEKRNLLEPSWWAPENSQAMPRIEDLEIKARHRVCKSCGKDQPQIYKQAWYCPDPDCNPKGLLENGLKLTDFAYDEAYLKSRASQDLSVAPRYNLVREPPVLKANAITQASGRDAWSGLVCPKCGRCNSREDWNGWKCGNEGCDFQHLMKHAVIPYTECLSGPEYDGHAICLDKCDTIVTDLGPCYRGQYSLRSFELLSGNIVTHIMGNKHTNGSDKGPNYIFHTLQEENMRLQRLRLPTAAQEGPKLTKHFAHNYGREYKYVARADSTPFKDAPKVVVNAISRLDWAAKVALNGQHFDGHNEILVVGYMQEQGMGYHDDGETGLGPVVASLSLGGDATMQWRLKQKYYLPKHMEMENIDSYDPKKPVRPGSKFWERRTALNSAYNNKEMSRKEWKEMKSDVYRAYKRSSKANCPVLISMQLRHGDYMIMNGDQIQKYYEHQVECSGNKLRYALTARTIDAEMHGIKEEDKWQSQYQLDPEDVYHGE